MSDIDIERLRHALKEWDHGETRIAAQWLLDLADEGGELWRETECPHGEVFRHSLCQRAEHAPSDCLGWCDDGSRVRVWPPDWTAARGAVPNNDGRTAADIFREGREA